ncbi:hypothetical protein C8R43DRAFT_187314 [Mycena crocata]|nr:hypothetical protein C8R43DRAFT_187314 [Mycena crocata]
MSVMDDSPKSVSEYILFHIDTVALIYPSNVARASARVRIDDQRDHLKTSLNVVHGNPIAWKENLAPIPLTPTSQITFELKHTPSRWKGWELAVTETRPLSSLLKIQGGVPNIILPLCSLRKSELGVKIGTITLTIRQLSPAEAVKIVLNIASITVHEFTINSKGFSTKHAARYQAGYEALKPICGILDIVGPIIAFSPEPICGAVISIVRGAAKSVKDQIEQDAEVLGLLKTIEHIYALVLGISDLRAQHANALSEAALLALMRTVGECTQFMQSFCKSTFLGRVARNPEKTKELESIQARLTQARQNLQTAMTLETTHTFTRVERTINKIGVEEVLERLVRIDMSAMCGMERCTNGAYSATLAQITSWVTSPLQDGKNVLWLRGSAGSGKTRVLNTLFDTFSHAHQIGGNFFFFEKDRTPKDPAYMVQTFAAQLGALHPLLGHDIAHHINKPPGLLLCSIEEQFTGLLLEPLLAHAYVGPLVFLVGGLEWCGHIGDEPIKPRAEQEVLQEVLRVLVQGSSRFPPNVRLLISSRESASIRELLGGSERVVELELEAAAAIE